MTELIRRVQQMIEEEREFQAEVERLHARVDNMLGEHNLPTN